MTGHGLGPISPNKAVGWYLEHRCDDTRLATRRKQASALGIFVDWTVDVGIENMNDVHGRELMAFKTWRRTETDVKVVSLNGTLAILRTFIGFCETIDAVEADLADRVPMPNVPEDEEISDVVPTDEEVDGMRS